MGVPAGIGKTVPTLTGADAGGYIAKVIEDSFPSPKPAGEFTLEGVDDLGFLTGHHEIPRLGIIDAQGISPQFNGVQPLLLAFHECVGNRNNEMKLVLIR